MPQPQLRLRYDLPNAPWFLPPQILHQHGIDTCIVGDAAASIYGSDVVVYNFIIAVSDPQLVAAKSHKATKNISSKRICSGRLRSSQMIRVPGASSLRRLYGDDPC